MLKINNINIGINNPVFIIAELSANHNQDFKLALKTIKAAKDAGADAIKIQTYTADTITIDCNNEYFIIKGGTIWDGVNDKWIMDNIELYPNNKFEVYNRYGQKVFEGLNYDNTTVYWNGMYNERQLPESTYYYTIDLGNEQFINDI